MYTPILKWKAGEKRALQKLPDKIKDQILPIFELQPCSDTDDINTIAKKFGDDITKCFGPNRDFMLDFSYFDLDMTSSEYVKKFLSISLSKGANCIPVISLENYNLLLDQFIESKNFIKHGIAIRITAETILEYDELMKKIIDKIQIEKRSITLIIDFETIDEKNFNLFVLGFKNIKDNSNLNEYNRTIVTATGFPNGFPSFYMNNETMKLFERTELLLWKKIDTSGINNIHFGDYCCNSPAPLIADTSNLRPSAIIKYTTENSWLIVKGGQLFREGYSQYCDLSKKIIQSDYFMGENYSYGDKYIYDCAHKDKDQDKNFGNPTTWVQVATNHHITLMVNHSFNL